MGITRMRSKVLVFGDDEDDVRQEQGPHVGSADASDSDDEENDGEVEKEVHCNTRLDMASSPVDVAAAFEPLSDEDAADPAGDLATDTAALAESSLNSPDSTTDVTDSTASVVVAVATANTSAVAVATTTTSSNAVVVTATVSTVATSDCKRKRDNDALDADDDVQPLRLRKVQRSNSSAIAAAVAAVKRSRTQSSPSFASPSNMLSPLKDASKKRPTPQKGRVPKKPQSLSAKLQTIDMTPAYVETLIAELFREQERDDRHMYNILTSTVREHTQCERSDVVEELSTMEFRRMLTYGEVSVSSVSQTILPFLQLRADDVFYDLGCGSGKIVLQVLLQTPCAVAKGIELMQNRVQQGDDALARLLAKDLPIMADKHAAIVQGDICRPPPTAAITDATVVFINNVCFGPELMLRVTQLLTQLPHLRRVVTLRKFCDRHRPQKCQRNNSHCVEYVHPPPEAEINVSWASKTSVYVYERVGFSIAQLAAQLQPPHAVVAVSSDVQM